ncbi:MAG: single-stranded-DNA-specific exonuclease RecJ [Chitinophagaceae bacterium]|nr:single-stranded-DNA-specific exonuclease RecJ [Chitinophagaceae bacterium]
MKRWRILPYQEQLTQDLVKALSINSTICQILTQRGIHTFNEAKEYFRPHLNQLHDPWLMKDMQKAVERIQQAFQQKENILVFGDYDVDGTTSVASMYQFLKKLYPNVDYYIPHRYKEGYGVSKLGIDYAKENNFSLIISLDCGIKSADLISYAKDLGIDFIVCDHHLPDAILPPAVAILNPKQNDCYYPYKELCGCGVGFKLMQALAETFKLEPESYLQYLDLVATAIAADIVPINGENRTLAFFGLERVNSKPCIGIKALMELAAVKDSMTISNLVFIIAPRINAAGRMDDAKKAVQLFIEQDVDQAFELAKILQSDNSDRKEADASITAEALSIIENCNDATTRKSTVVYREHWHKGVVGIVASRLIENYYRPTVVLAKSGDIVAGSARSVPGFNLYEAIYACKDHLIGFGGHFAAAGLTLEESKIEDFKTAFEEAVAKHITPEQLIPEIVIDSEIRFDEINLSFYNILKQMEPFGPENMRPVFISTKVYNTGFCKVVKEQHIKFSLKQGNTTINGIGFGIAEKFSILEMNRPIDVVYTIDLNEWNGNKSVQLKVIDIKLSE